MKKVTYQGRPGAYSHLACKALFPHAVAEGRRTFQGAMEQVAQHKADAAVIPVENSTAGRVADMHFLMPQIDLHIVGEYFLPIRHALLAPKGTPIEQITDVYSHEQALAQCRKHIQAADMHAHVEEDTAAAAEMIANENDPTKAALASAEAAKEYGLEILHEDFQDTLHNTTRFLVWAPTPITPDMAQPCLITFIFQVNNVPAALYHAIGAFATNGVNMLKLESYMLDGAFTTTQFLVDIEGHIELPQVQAAFKALEAYASHIKVLGMYGAHSSRTAGQS